MLLEIWTRDEETSQNCAAPRGREGRSEVAKRNPEPTKAAHQ